MITKLFYSRTPQLILIFFIFSTSLFSQNEFITTWKTDNTGSSNDTSITIPTTGAGYNYDVDWDNDGTFDEFGLTGNVTHDFGVAGTYTIRIQGAFPRIYFNNGGDKQKIISVDQWGIIAWTSMAFAFYGTSNLVGNASDAPDLSGVISMRLMFGFCAIFNQDISSWDTSTITDMNNIFGGSPTFNNGGQPLTWNTSAATNMSGLFTNCTNFNQDISSWNTSSVTNMSHMFRNAIAFNQNISGWNTGLVTTMANMFDGASMFNQSIGGWDTSMVTDMGTMFRSAIAFNQDISAWDTSAVTNMAFMFQFTTAFNNGGQPLNWTTTSLTYMDVMFSSATAFNQDISSWDISLVTSLGSLFISASAFNNGGQPLTWDTSSVSWMGNVFGSAAAFNQDISSWNVSNVTGFANMFDGASTYNNGGVPLNWNTTGLTSLGRLFSGATAFNQDISAWDVSSVTDMYRVFERATAFNNNGQPLNWTTTAATSMEQMFSGATTFNQDISSWDIGNVARFYNMFDGASSYNNGGQPLNWNTTGLTDFSQMFKNATAFDQNIGSWDVESVTAFFEMFTGATLSDANYDALLIGWDAQNLSPSIAFDGGNSQYCTMSAQTARANMVNTLGNGGDGWAITDGGLFGGSCGLGIEDNELDDSIILYPNPVDDMVIIESENLLESILVYDMSGRVIIKTIVEENRREKSISVSSLSSGLYFINAQSNKGQSIIKIIKK